MLRSCSGGLQPWVNICKCVTSLQGIILHCGQRNWSEEPCRHFGNDEDSAELQMITMTDGNVLKVVIDQSEWTIMLQMEDTDINGNERIHETNCYDAG